MGGLALVVSQSGLSREGGLIRGVSQDRYISGCSVFHTNLRYMQKVHQQKIDNIDPGILTKLTIYYLNNKIREQSRIYGSICGPAS